MALSVKKKSLDFGLLIIVLVLMIFGVVMVFSASYYDTISESGNPYYYLLRVSVWFAAGLVIMFVLSAIPYELYYKLAPVILAVSLILLVLLFTPLGDDRGGAVRWIEIGPVTFMPGEVAKLGALIFAAWYYTKYAKFTYTFTKGVLPMLMLAGMFFILIYLQPNLSTAIIICGIIIGMMFVAGIKISYFIGLMVAGIGAVTVLIFTKGEFHMARVLSFLDPFADPQGDSYQVIQSLLALATGGVYGVGPGNSIQKAQYLPEAQNDFIFAIIGEEYGFIGCLVLMTVFILLIWKGAMVSMNAANRFGMLLAAGITILFALQVIMNIAVVTSVMPPTGVILPFISYGGNAMLVFSAAAGILLNISKYRKESKPKRAVKLEEELI